VQNTRPWRRMLLCCLKDPPSTFFVYCVLMQGARHPNIEHVALRCVLQRRRWATVQLPFVVRLRVDKLPRDAMAGDAMAGVLARYLGGLLLCVWTVARACVCMFESCAYVYVYYGLRVRVHVS
jgi:hypothetical protein